MTPYLKYKFKNFSQVTWKDFKYFKMCQESLTHIFTFTSLCMIYPFFLETNSKNYCVVLKVSGLSILKPRSLVKQRKEITTEHEISKMVKYSGSHSDLYLLCSISAPKTSLSRLN